MSHGSKDNQHKDVHVNSSPSKSLIYKIEKKQCDELRKKQLKAYIKQRIKTEVEIGHKIVHPNIVRFLYFSETSRNIYIFMELCQTNLEQIVKTRGRLSETEAIPLFKHLVEAGCVLYDHNITHRDIKAQNILVKDGVAKLADFGFAKQLRQKDVQQDGTGVGTILYMAPQLIFEEKPVYSIRCDVWSIGVVMYYALYGKVPWETNQNLQSFHLSLRKPIGFDPQVQLSSRIKNLISRMLIFKDEQRISIKQAREVLSDMMAE